MAILNKDSIVYQAETKLVDLVYEACLASSLRKKKEELYDAAKIRYLLKALEAADEYLTLQQSSQICQCLIEVSEITDYPTAPNLTVSSVPNVLIGIPGADGADGADGAQGPAGPTGPAGSGVETFTFTGQTAVDIVLDTIENAASPYHTAARWDIYATRTDTSNVAIFGTVVGAMCNSTSVNHFSDVSTIGTTSAYFDVEENYPEIRLHFKRAAGTETWLIHVKRYIITDFAII